MADTRRIATDFGIAAPAVALGGWIVLLAVAFRRRDGETDASAR